MNRTTRQPRWTLTAVSAITLVAAAGAGIAFAGARPPRHPTPCVGVVSIDFGADGTVDAVDETPLPDCGGSHRDHLVERTSR